MPKSRKSIKRRAKNKRIQAVLSARGKIFVERYMSRKGIRLLMNKEISKQKAWEKYGKNRYRNNPDARVIKFIKHEL